MDAITQLQQQLAEPVNGFIGEYWPFLIVLAVALASWFFNPRWRDSNGVVISMSTDGDKDGSDGDGGDGGGGDGGGGGD